MLLCELMLRIVDVCEVSTAEVKRVFAIFKNYRWFSVGCLVVCGRVILVRLVSLHSHGHSNHGTCICSGGGGKGECYVGSLCATLQASKETMI